MATIQDPAALTSTATQYILSKFYDKVLLKRLLPELRWYQASEKRRLPRHGGKEIKFSAFKKLTVGTRLSEGVKPTPKVLSTYNVTAQLGQWGDFSAVSDLMEVTGKRIMPYFQVIDYSETSNNGQNLVVDETVAETPERLTRAA